MIERSRRVVLLIDYDNLQICASRDTPGRELQLPPVVQLAQRYGTVILARAYAEWNLSTERLAVYKAGIEPAFAPVLRTESDRSGKSLADTVMVAEGMDMLWTLSPDVVVLATSDKDLIPLVRVAKQRGAFVVVLGSDFTAIPLREMADDHVTYRQLITDGNGRLTDPPSARQPAALPEPARRRPRERTGRERIGVPPTTAAPAPVRTERESAPMVPSPAPASVPLPAASTAPLAPASASISSIAPQSEAVAPVSGGIGGDADGQGGTRRRRRRGSRRRSERLGVAGDGTSFGEPGAQTDAFSQDDAGDQDEYEPAAFSSTSSGTVEEPLDPSEASALLFAASEDDSIVAGLDAPESEPVQAALDEAPIDAPAAPAAAAPRDRRRRTRRPAAEPAAVVAEVEVAETPVTPDAENMAGSLPLADMLAGGEPIASENGVQSSDDDVPPAAPTTRPRRVASASRGRRTR